MQAVAEARCVLRRGGGLVQADELRPGSLACPHIRRVEVLRRGRRPDRKAQERHACLGERAPALPVVARLAGGDDVLPDVLATAVTRHHVIERQVVTALPAVLAGVVVTDEDFLTGHLHDGARTLHVVREADDRWRRKAHPLARDQVAVLLDDARLLLREEDHRPADVADVQRLEVEVEHEHVRVDYAHVPILRSERYDGVPMSAHSTPGQNGSKGTWTLKTGLAQMLKGGVIMDVVTPEHAKIAEDAGAVAVMALERVPADIRASGGVARMSDPEMIQRIMEAVTIPVMAKCRIGHFAEAQVLESLGVDYVDESEVLTPADETNHIDKHAFKVPFVCGCRNLGEALRRINEGVAMIRTKGEAGTGNVVEAVRQLRTVLAEIRRLPSMRDDELFVAAKELQAPYELVKGVAEDGRLPVVNFVAGGISTPADAALVMQLGSEGVFVGSGIFKSEDPARMANAIVQATTHFDDPKILADVSKGLGSPMRGLALEQIPEAERLAVRGW